MHGNSTWSGVCVLFVAYSIEIFKKTLRNDVIPLMGSLSSVCPLQTCNWLLARLWFWIIPSYHVHQDDSVLANLPSTGVLNDHLLCSMCKNAYQHFTRLVFPSAATEIRSKIVWEGLASRPALLVAWPSSTAVTWLYFGSQQRAAFATCVPSGNTPKALAT